MGAPQGLPSQVLLAGGAGFIGSHFCRRFELEHIRYVVLDLHEPEQGLSPQRFVRGDVRDARAVADAISGCDAVLHLAAAHHDSGIDEDTYFSVNARGTGVLARAAVEQGISRFCFYSSAAVYGEASTVRDEGSETHPTSAYGASKLEGERLLAEIHRASGLPILVIRPSVTFGENNFANMYSLLRQIDSGRFLQVGDGQNRKSLSYVENLVDFTMWAWSRHSEGLDVFNWVESPDLSSGEIVQELARLVGRRLLPISVPLPIAEFAAGIVEIICRGLGQSTAVSPMRVRKLAKDQTRFSASKARAAGFSESITLAEGLSRTARWYLTSGRNQTVVRRLPPVWTPVD